MAIELLLFIFLSSPILLITIITLLITISFLSRLTNNTANKYRNLPPGNLGGGLLFIGDTIAFMRPHSSAGLGGFVDRHIARHGRIFKMRVFRKATIVSADAEMNRFILQGEEKLFQCSYPKGVENILGKWSMLALTGEIHREMRSGRLSCSPEGGGSSANHAARGALGKIL